MNQPNSAANRERAVQATCVHDDGSEHPSDGSLPCAQIARKSCPCCEAVDAMGRTTSGDLFCTVCGWIDPALGAIQ